MALQLENGKVGALAYSIYVEGELIETVERDDALEYLHGRENVVPGLEAALAGKQVGDKFDVSVPPEEAYGEYNEDLLTAIPLEEFDYDEEEGELQIGMEVEMMDEEGEILDGTIVVIERDAVIVDLNPPLAGKIVRYAGEVVGVRDATEAELEWGYPESLLAEMFGDDEDDWENEE